MLHVWVDFACRKNSVVNEDQAGGEFRIVGGCLQKERLDSLPVCKNFSSDGLTGGHFDEGVIKRAAMKLSLSEVVLQEIEEGVNCVRACARSEAKCFLEIHPQRLEIGGDESFLTGERGVEARFCHAGIGDDKVDSGVVDASLVKQSSCRA